MLGALVLVLSIILIESRTDIGQDVRLLERVKRWREFDCPPPFYPSQHRYHFHPPPYWHHRPPGDDYYQPYPNPEPEPEPQGRYRQTSTEANKLDKESSSETVPNKNEKRSENLIVKDENNTPPVIPKIPECDDCNGAKTAISNAESDTGDAVAISISRKN